MGAVVCQVDWVEVVKSLSEYWMLSNSTWEHKRKQFLLEKFFVFCFLQQFILEPCFWSHFR